MARVRGEVHVKDARPLPSSLAIAPQIFTCVQSLQENQTLSKTLLPESLVRLLQR